jgi:hypothetical protein
MANGLGGLPRNSFQDVGRAPQPERGDALAAAAQDKPIAEDVAPDYADWDLVEYASASDDSGVTVRMRLPDESQFGVHETKGDGAHSARHVPEQVAFHSRPEVRQPRPHVPQPAAHIAPHDAAIIPFGDELQLGGDVAIDINDGPGPDPIFSENKRSRVMGAIGGATGLAGGAMAPLHPFLRAEVTATTAAVGFALGGLASGRAGKQVSPFAQPSDPTDKAFQVRQHDGVRQAVGAAVAARNGDPQEALRLANVAVNAAQVTLHVNDKAVAELKAGIAKLYPSKAGNEAWLARAAAHLMINGVVGTKDEKDELGTTCRYGLQTLYDTGIRRDYARSVSTALINYTPSFGVANFTTEAMRQAGMPAPVSWIAGSMEIGFGQEHPMNVGLAPSKYTRAPTANEKAHAMYAFADRASFWPFALDHVAGDVTTAFNVGYLRVGTGYAAAAMTGMQRAQMDLASANFEPAWADPDHPGAAQLINGLRGTDAAAAGDFLKDVAKNVSKGPLSNFNARRGLTRMLFAMACAAPRAATGMFEMDSTARMSLMLATNGLLGGWGAINRYLVLNFPAQPAVGFPGPLHPEAAGLPNANEVRAMRTPPDPNALDLEAGLVPAEIPGANGPTLRAADVDPLLKPGDHNV